MSGAGYALSMLSYRISGEKAGWLTFIAFSVLPATTFGYTIVTPDSPLLLFWCLALYWGYLAVTGDGNRYFILAGAAVALMITSKYTAVLFPAAVVIYILLFNRALLGNKYTWIACFIGASGVLPILIWNIQHDFVSIRFQYAHGTSDTFEIVWREFFTLLGGIQLLPTPIFAFIIYKVSFYFKGYRKETWWKYLLTLFLVPTLFFIYKGLFKKMELNWPIIGFLSAIPMMAVYVADGHHRRLFKFGAVFAGILTVIIMSMPFLPLPDNINIALRLAGNRESVEELKRVMIVDDNKNFFSDSWSNASIMTYYLDDHPRVYIPTRSRYSQFDIWNKGTDYSPMKGYYMGTSDRGSELREIFGVAELMKRFPTGSPTRPKYFYIYKVGR